MTDFTAVATLSDLAYVLSDGMPEYFQSVAYNAATDYCVGILVLVRGAYRANLFNDTSSWHYEIRDTSTDTVIRTASWDDLSTDTATLNTVITRVTTDLIAQIDALPIP
jgi:hypothetical protein